MSEQKVTQKSQQRRVRVSNGLLVVLLSLAAGFGGGLLGAKSYQTNSFGISTANQQIVLSESELINQIAEKTGASVVSVNVTGRATTSDFFGFTRQLESASAGTGVIISEQGDIVTNRHVVPAGTAEVSITLSNGESFDCEVVGRTNENDSLDVAFLKIKDLGDTKLTVARLGDSDALKVGAKVIAIGNALGEFQNTVTSGIISGFNRDIVAGDSASSENLQNLIQTDTAINQGNSGGPLVNINGEVIGINTAVAGGSAENIGFAIPINDIKSLIDSVLTSGKLERPYLGVRYIMLSEEISEQLDIEQTNGAYIAEASQGQVSILPDSPADKAGLKQRDIILKVGDSDVTRERSLASLINRHKVGETVTLTIIRDKQEQKIDVTLEAPPNS